MSGKPIGELNGRWALAFKISQVTVPIFIFLFATVAIPWCVWVTKQLSEHNVQIAQIREWQGKGSRFDETDAENLRMRVKSEIAMEITGKLYEKIEVMNSNIIRLEEAVKRLQSSQQQASARVLQANTTP